MSYEEKAPYYSIRVRIGDVTSPKELAMGRYKDRTIEVTYGNQDERVIKNPKDVADVSIKNLKDQLLDIFKQTDEVAKERDYHYLDQIKQEGK